MPIPPIGEYARRAFLPAESDVGSKALVILGTFRNTGTLSSGIDEEVYVPRSFNSINSVLLALLILTFTFKARGSAVVR